MLLDKAKEEYGTLPDERNSFPAVDARGTKICERHRTKKRNWCLRPRAATFPRLKNW